MTEGTIMSARIVESLFGAALALAVTAAASAEVAKNSANYMMPGCRDFLDLRS